MKTNSCSKQGFTSAVKECLEGRIDSDVEREGRWSGSVAVALGDDWAGSTVITFYLFLRICISSLLDEDMKMNSSLNNIMDETEENLFWMNLIEVL